MATVGDATYPSPSEILQTILDAIVFAYVAQGLAAPNVLPGSDHYIRAQANASRVSIAIANNKISAAASNPLTATGDDLVQLAAIFGVQPSPAGPSTGAVTIAASAAVTIPSGFTGEINGQLYQVTQTYLTIPTGTAVSLVALTAGFVGNQPAGSTLTWQSAAIGALGPTATVTGAGITGGVDADNDDRLRSKLLQKLSAPPVGGNWSSVIEWAEGASASVEAAYVYPAARGAASYDVAVTALGGNRTLSPTVLGLVRAAIVARMPGQNDLNVTSVTAQGVDVIVSLKLPLPQGAGGAGGGWRDAAPWPAEVTKCTAYNAGTQTATVNSAASPTSGNSIGVWDPTFADPDTGIIVGIMREYTVATVGGSMGAWTLTVQGGFLHTPLAQYVSAGALSLTSYAATFAAAAAKLGPGEKTAFLELLPRAARQPTVDSANTAQPGLTARLLDSVDTAFPEVIDIGYAATYSAGTTTPQTQPTVPATTADPPGILVVNSLAFIKS